MRPRTLMIVLPLTLVVALTVQGLPTRAAAAHVDAARSSASQRLHFATAPGYRLAVAGSGWAANDRLAFTVQTGTVAGQIVLRTTQRGSFLVALVNVNLCAGVTLTVRDTSGRFATLKGPRLACPTPRVVPAPALKVLKGTLVTPEPSPPAQGQTGGWRVYRNPVAGYSVEYPSSWVVHEAPKENARYETVFAAPDGSATIQVSVLPGTADEGAFLDIPNTRCHVVQIGTLSGTRCIDTIGFVQSTTLVGSGKTFTISMSLKRSPADVYEHMVQTFHLLP